MSYMALVIISTSSYLGAWIGRKRGDGTKGYIYALSAGAGYLVALLAVSLLVFRSGIKGLMPTALVISAGSMISCWPGKRKGRGLPKRHGGRHG